MKRDKLITALCLIYAYFILFMLLVSPSNATQALKADTATLVLVGPFVDKDDGLTPEDSLTLGAADDAVAFKHNTQTSTDISSLTFTSKSDVAGGWYMLSLTSSETDTEGQLTVIVRDDSVTLPVFATFQVVNANVYDSLYAAATTDYLQTDTIQVSGDATSADNLELQYDTTGLAGDTFPATQSQLSGIANVGAATNRPAISYTLSTGTQSAGVLGDTEELNGTRHTHTDVSDEMVLYYEFSIGSGFPISVVVTGYLNGNNDDLQVEGYDWVSSSWKQIGTLAGKNSSTNEVNAFELFVDMVGSAGDEGTVRVRFNDGAFTLSSATLAIDQIYLSFALGQEGYDNGAIWIDTTVSNTNTVVGIDGTSRNPVSTIGAANTLSASTNLNRFEVAPGSSITFAVSQENQVFNGENWTLDLGGRSISGTHIAGATVTGTATGATAPRFEHVHFGVTTLPPSDVEASVFEGTITAGSAGDFFFEKCQSGVAGASTPVFDFGSGLDASQVNFRDFSGGIEIRNMGAGSGTYNMSLEGNGQLVIASTSTGGTIAIRGNFTITDNVVGGFVVGGGVISDDARYDVTQINDEVLDVMNVDTFSEPGQENPTATPTIREMNHFLYKTFRNEKRTSATEFKVYNNAGDTVDQKSTRADDGTDYTQGEMETGP